MLDITNTVGKFAPYLKSGVKEEMRGEVIQSSLSSAEVDPQSGMTISLTKNDNMIDSNPYPPAPMFPLVMAICWSVQFCCWSLWMRSCEILRPPSSSSAENM